PAIATSRVSHAAPGRKVDVTVVTRATTGAGCSSTRRLLALRRIRGASQRSPCSAATASAAASARRLSGEEVTGRWQALGRTAAMRWRARPGSSAPSQRGEQALQVRLVVPRADGRAQQAPAGELADDDAGGGAPRDRGRRVGVRPRDERRASARRDLETARGE